MMRKLVFTFLLAFLSFAPVVLVHAQGPTATPDSSNSFGQLRETDVVTMPGGFDFTPVEIVTSTLALSLTFGIDEINTIGQVVTSMFALIDQHYYLPYILVVMLAMLVLRWLYRFVTGDLSRATTLNASRAIDDYYDIQDRRFQKAENERIESANLRIAETDGLSGEDEDYLSDFISNSSRADVRKFRSQSRRNRNRTRSIIRFFRR